MDQQVRRSRYDYTLSFKMGVVERIERGELSARQAQRQYGIQGNCTVLNWLRKHGQWDGNTASSSGTVQEMVMGKSHSPLTPEQQQIKQLQGELKEAREKANLFEAVLDVLRKDYGVVVKKPLGKSSRKSSSRG